MWTTFFDDLPTMSPKALETSSMQCLVSLGELLGFQCSLEKLRPFANSAAVLGVEVDCSSVAEGRLLIRNKEGRTSEVSEVITQALSVGRLSLKEYQRVMGRIQYADAQIMGRTGKLAMAEIRSWVRNAGGDLVLGSESRAAYKLLLHRFSAAEDRVVPCSPTGKTAYIFTDGASEGDVHTIGGILFLEGKQPHFFACHVPKSLTLEWSKSLDHLIGPVEAYALVMARVLWHQHVAGLRCVYYVDNFAVLHAFIKGTSPSSHFREALRSFEDKERVEASWPWFSRVPSDSNCADDPSKRLGSSSMLSGSDSRGRAQPWQKSTEPQALISTREKCYGRLKTAKSKNGKTQDTAKPALSKKVQDSKGCSSPYRTMIWSKEDWSFSTRNSPSARFAIWSANTSRKRSLWQVYGLCMLALLVSTWVLSATPHALQSWEKASLASGMRIWDEPYQQVQFGRGPTADSDRESACKRVAANVGRRDMTRFCVAVQVGWNTCLDSCHHCNVCSRCLFAPCLSSHRTWPARIPLPAVWEQTRHRHRMAPQRMPLRMFFNSRTVASSCFRRQPGGSLMRCSNGLHRSKLHTSLTPISTWKSLSRTIRYHETPCKGRPQLGSHPLRDAKVERGRIDRRLSAWSKQEKRPPRWYMTDSCLKGLRPRTQWAMRREVTWHKGLRFAVGCHFWPHSAAR